MRRLEPSTILMISLSVATLLLTFLICFLLPRIQQFDDVTLYNPVYMYLNYGKITYPVHGFFDSTIVHPPIHYFIIAKLIQFGIKDFFAITLPPFILTVICIIQILRIPGNKDLKFALLLGLIAPILLVTFITIMQSIRPDFSLALAWYAGLISLESSRLKGWKATDLFLGSFLITYASGLHYYACIAFLGIAVYLISMIRTKGWNHKVVYLFAGGLSFGIPYLIFYVAPFFNQILEVVHSNQGEGGIKEAVLRHFEMYELLNMRFPFFNPFGFASLIKVPLAIIGLLLLSISKRTRLLGLASLPLTLFVFLFSRGKSEGYYLPEIMIFFFGLSFILIGFGKAILKNHVLKQVLAIVLSIAIMGAVLIVGITNYDQLGANPDLELHLSRACAKDVIGENKYVGSRMALWYLGGGDKWSDITVIPKNELDLTRFDVLEEYLHHSHKLDKSREYVLSRMYLDSAINLLGFYTSDYNDYPSELSFLMFSFDKPTEIKGFGYINNDSLYRFDQNRRGNYIFITFLCKKGGCSRENKAVAYLLDNATCFGFTRLPEQTDPADIIDYQSKESLGWIVISYGKYLTCESRLPDDLFIRDKFRVTATLVDKKRMIRQLSEGDHTIEFVRLRK